MLITYCTFPCADDLPIWGIVGEIDEKEDAFYIWTHKKFEIGYNRDQVRIIIYTVRYRYLLLHVPNADSGPGVVTRTH